MILTFRPIERWPIERTEHTKRNPFRATWTDTLKILDRELTLVGAKDPVLQVDASERDFRLDGQLRADARLRSDGVILSFHHPQQGPLSYPCDSYTGGRVWIPRTERRDADREQTRTLPGWQVNVRAIALTLEALRAVERYGAAQTGQQYTGWKQLGAGIPMGPAMTADQAARHLAKEAVMVGDSPDDLIWPWGPDGKGYVVLLHDKTEATRAYRLAARRLHPDAGGSTEEFQRLQQAHDLLISA